MAPEVIYSGEPTNGKENMTVITERKKEYWIFIVGMLLILLALSRYIVNGEPVDIRSDITGETVMMTDGMEIIQRLTIPEEANWRQGYYELLFMKCDSDSDGQIVCTLKQGNWQETGRIRLDRISAGEWTPLKKLDFGRLESGTASLCISTEGVMEGELEVAVGPDYYGFGNLLLNGSEQQTTLVQAYHYHVTGMEYRIRLLCYGIVVVCAGILALLVRGACRKGKEKSLAAFVVLTVMLMAVIYLLDSSVYLEPAYAEAVTNFLDYARERKLAENLLITDAGYLPLLPRLITLFFLKLLRISSVYALYFMQAAACLLCSMVWAFFVLPPFCGWMRFYNRILWCVLVMMTCFCEETLFFTNHAYWGIYLLLLLLAADLECLSGWIYAGLLGVGALICLSKGTYAVMLPLTVLYLCFFRRSISKRDKLYACVVGCASLLQILYSFSGQGDGEGWIDAASMGQIGYWFRLAGRTFTEFTVSLLAPAGEVVQYVPGLIVMMTAAVIVFLAADFIRMVLLSGIRGQIVERQRVLFYTFVTFQLIVCAFFLMTVKQVPDSWNEMGRINFVQMGDKYEIFSNMGFYMLAVTGSALVVQRSMSRQRLTALPDCGRYGVVLLILVFCLTNPVMKLSGWADAEVSDGRVYAGDINASWWDYKEMISESSFFIPVRGDNWAYSRNCNLYQVGAEIYFEETSGFNLDETITGYHSTYEIQDAAQAQNLIEVMIENPSRIDGAVLRVWLLDEDGNVIADVGQFDSGRNKKCIFRLDEPVSGVKRMEFTDDAGNPVYYKDYIAWASAW